MNRPTWNDVFDAIWAVTTLVIFTCSLVALYLVVFVLPHK